MDKLVMTITLAFLLTMIGRSCVKYFFSCDDEVGDVIVAHFVGDNRVFEVVTEVVGILLILPLV